MSFAVLYNSYSFHFIIAKPERMIINKATNLPIVSLNDFAELSTYDLIDKKEGILKDFDMEESTVNKMIMKARESWFPEDAKKTEEAVDDTSINNE